MPKLDVGVGWIEVEVTGPPNLINTFRGYTPVLPVKEARTSLDYWLFVQAKSIAEKLEPLREQNNGRFEGLKFRIRKQSMEKLAKYEIEPA